MPEWPDLHVLRGRLETALTGRTIAAVRVGDPIVIRAVRPVDELLVGHAFRAVRLRGKFLIFELDGPTVVVNPMLAGLFQLPDARTKTTRDTRLTFVLDDGRELRYRDDVKMGKLYVLPEGESPEQAVPGYAGLGPDADDLERFAARARARGGEVRNLLMDQRVIAGIGNAYADEILWEAQLHPKRAVRSLQPEETERLVTAIDRVLRWATGEVEEGMPPSLGVKVRRHMRVRGRAGSPCPRCGAVLKRTRKGDDDTDLCTVCQPPPAGVLR